jgi:hypothetical protein
MLISEDNDKLPCGRRIFFNEGKLFVVLSENDEEVGVRTVITMEQYCNTCRKRDILIQQINTIETEEERIDLQKKIDVLTKLLGEDHIGPLPKCNTRIEAATGEHFSSGKTIVDDDIQEMSKMIRTYGFPSVMLFMAFYANSSKLGLEWMELLFKETAMQAKRLKNTPDLDKTNPLYDQIMEAIRITDMGVAPVHQCGMNDTDKDVGKSNDDRMYC